MKKLYFLSVLFFFGTALFAQEQREAWVPGELYVRIKETSASGMFDETGQIIPSAFYKAYPGLETLGGLISLESPFAAAKGHELRHTIRLRVNNPQFLEQYILYFELEEETEYAERIPMNYIDYTPNDLGPNSTNNQWQLYKIMAREAWDISKGSKNITVAVVDDALMITHPDLKNNIWVNPGEIPGNGIDDDNNGYIDDINGWDAGDNDNNPVQPNTAFTHGTHVGGLAGATSDNGIGVASIGFNISLIGVKSTLNGQSSIVSIPRGYEGILYAANAGADIINCSWGSSFFSQTGQSTVNYAINKGSILVAAMGNDNRELMQYPAAFTGVISVAATANNDTRSNYSNYATYTSISAPGNSLNSTLANGGYGQQSGTSMATPVVSGLLALMKSHFQGATITELRNCLFNNADNIDVLNPSYAGKLGRGRINAYKSLQCMDTLKRTTAPQVQINSNGLQACPNSTISFSALSLRGDIDSFYWEFPGGSPSFSTDAKPNIFYATLGTYDVRLRVFNQAGMALDSLINGVEISGNGISNAYYFGFDGSLSDWTITSADPLFTWKQDTLNLNGSSAYVLKVNAFNGNNPGAVNSLLSPIMDMTDFGNIRLKMEYAYAPVSLSANDSLVIWISADSGKTFREAYRVGLSTEWNNNAVQSTGFVPTSQAQWCYATKRCADIDLRWLDRKAGIQVRIDHIGASQANNLYLDNIAFAASCAKYNTNAPTALFRSQVQKGCDNLTITLENLSGNFPVSYQWHFPGGQPAVSDDVTPTVNYIQPGKYAIALKVTSLYGSDSLYLTDYIEVNSRPQINISATDTSLCRGESTEFTASGANSYTWSPVVAISATTGPKVKATPSSNTTYTVTGTNLAGCTNTATVAIVVLSTPPEPLISRSGNVLSVAQFNGVSYQWLLNNQPIQGANTNQHTAVSSGTYEIELTNNLTGCTSRSLEPLNVTFTSLQEIAGLGYLLYPNPANTSVTLESEESLESYRLMDISGRIVAEGNVGKGKRVVISLQDMSTGVYVLEWQHSGGVQRAKLIKN